jgi:hypothetical protein
MIRHYVLSSRKLMKVDDQYTYDHVSPSNENGTDHALHYFNIGRYHIPITQKGLKVGLPEFMNDGGSYETRDYETLNHGFQFPGEDSKRMFEEIFQELSKTPEKVLYIYLFGFGNHVKRELKVQIKPMTEHYHPRIDRSSPVGEMLFLSWPSQGFFEYKSGEIHDVETMGRLLAVFWLKLYHLVNDENNPLFRNWRPKIVFHAQSMGNRILAGAVKNLYELEKQKIIREDILNEFFHRLIMTGADVNKNTLDDFRPESEENIAKLAKKILLFHNSKDKALLIARIIFKEDERLGRNMTEEDLPLLPPNVDFIHLVKCHKDPSGHNYFSKNPYVSAGIKRSLLEFHFDGSEIDYKKRKKIVFNMKTGEVESSEFY